MREGGSAGIEEVTKVPNHQMSQSSSSRSFSDNALITEWQLLQEKTPEGEPKAAARQIRPEGVVCIKTWDVENNKVTFISVPAHLICATGNI